MKKVILVILSIILIVVVLWIGLHFWKNRNIPNNVVQNTQSGQNQYTHSSGQVSWEVPPDFGLAVSKDQVLVKSYIPPCEEGFDYCMYYNLKNFDGTNFESAGVSIGMRDDLLNNEACLTRPPNEYLNFTPEVIKHDNYLVSSFFPIGDAGAGHYSNGKIYRIYLNTGKCIQIGTRIGETQFANYPEGTIKQFGSEDRKYLFSRFDTILNSLKIASTSEPIALPSSVI